MNFSRFILSWLTRKQKKSLSTKASQNIILYNHVKIKFSDYIEHFLSKILLTTAKTILNHKLFTLNSILKWELKASQ